MASLRGKVLYASKLLDKWLEERSDKSDAKTIDSVAPDKL